MENLRLDINPHIEHTDYNEGLVLHMAIPMLFVMAANVLDDGSFNVSSAQEHSVPTPQRLDNSLPRGTLDGTQGWCLRSSAPSD